MTDKTPNGYAYAGCTIHDLDRALFDLWSARSNQESCHLLTPKEYETLMQAEQQIRFIFLNCEKRLIENGIEP